MLKSIVLLTTTTGKFSLPVDLYTPTHTDAKLSSFCRRLHRDWSIVHLMGKKMLPYLVIVPAIPQAAHIGKNGLHGAGAGAGAVRKIKMMEKGSHGMLPFQGTSFHSGKRKAFKPHDKGYGGWGHPADHEHCIKLFIAKPTWRQTLGLK
jgi:hypothetical protein